MGAKRLGAIGTERRGGGTPVGTGPECGLLAAPTSCLRSSQSSFPARQGSQWRPTERAVRPPCGPSSEAPWREASPAGVQRRWHAPRSSAVDTLIFLPMFAPSFQRHTQTFERSHRGPVEAGVGLLEQAHAFSMPKNLAIELFDEDTAEKVANIMGEWSGCAKALAELKRRRANGERVMLFRSAGSVFVAAVSPVPCSESSGTEAL